MRTSRGMACAVRAWSRTWGRRKVRLWRILDTDFLGCSAVMAKAPFGASCFAWDQWGRRWGVFREPPLRYVYCSRNTPHPLLPEAAVVSLTFACGVGALA